MNNVTLLKGLKCQLIVTLMVILSLTDTLCIWYTLLINPLATDNTLMCGLRFGHDKHITAHVVSHLLAILVTRMFFKNVADGRVCFMNK